MATSLHHSGGTICEPVDLPVNKRHFDMVYSHMKYSDKPFMGSVTHPERARDTVEMAKILFGDGLHRPGDRPAAHLLISLINANSPMTCDSTMLGALKVYARANQATDRHAVHPRRRDVAGDGGRHRGADAGRGAGRHGVRAAGQSRRAGGASAASPPRSRCSPARRRSARRSRRWCCTSWRRSRAASACRFAPAAACAPRRSPMRRPRTSRPTRCCRPASRASTSCCTRPAGSKAAWPWATRNSSWTPTRPA